MTSRRKIIKSKASNSQRISKNTRKQLREKPPNLLGKPGEPKELQSTPARHEAWTPISITGQNLAKSLEAQPRETSSRSTAKQYSFLQNPSKAIEVF